MKHKIIFVLAICAFTAAMVPRDRRETATFCAETTPCAWSLYMPKTEIITEKVVNSYCVCSSEQTCVIAEDDKTVNAYVHRCRPTPEASDKS